MLEGLLVDLVPYGQRFWDTEHVWFNSEAQFWGSAGDRPIVTRAQFRRWREEHAGHNQHNPRVQFGIQTKPDAAEPCKPLGSISLGWVIPHHRLAMLGAVIGEPAYWGGGYGTDALLLIVDYAFEWLDFHKLWLGTMGINVRVHRQMEKVGFRQEGRARQHWYADGAYTDDVVYGLLREEWPGRAAVVERLGLKAKS